MDVMSPEQRRKAMQANRGRTRPELRIAAALWKLGHRYLTYDGYQERFGCRIIGKPDLIFSKLKVVIFVDGCFWHGCSRCHNFADDLNESWQNKIETNVQRDYRTRRRLRRLGWHVWRVWEHDLRTWKRFEKTVTKIHRRLIRYREQRIEQGNVKG